MQDPAIFKKKNKFFTIVEKADEVIIRFCCRTSFNGPLHVPSLSPYPGRDIKPGTPLADACARTLDLLGEEATGWALAWRINLWARLHKADRAFVCLKKQLCPASEQIGGCYPNLFGAHPPFQIDSNFGATAGIAEMLMQSRWYVSENRGEIHLLSALPESLPDGFITGLRAQGGITVSVYFAGAELTKAEFTLDSHISGREVKVTYKESTRTIQFKPGKTEVF